ncbi:MAG TPA: hypothetical protein VLH94_01755 [Spirochaetia bacterium]|nr:hypothetical protein [Spirochaetia bacterium]
MNRVVRQLLVFILFLHISSSAIFAADPYATGSAVVSATVIGTTTNAPILVSPDNNAAINTNRPSLVWKRPDPLPATPLHHYDVYLDDDLLATDISDSITSQTYYFYTIRRDNDTFYLEMTSDLDQGYHTWSVKVYDTSGTSASSETRTFYIDSIFPYILLETVDTRTLNWNTSISESIPEINNRNVLINNANPLLSGKVEPYANMVITLVCPQNIPNCQNQTYQGNYPTGIWQHRFNNLARGYIYTVSIAATDAGGNSTTFPEFYLIYGTVTPTPSAIITPKPTATIKPTPKISPTPTPPTATISATVSPTITPPEPTPELITPFVPYAPPAPTPPMIPSLAPEKANFFTQYWLLMLFVIGLPTHIFLTFYGAKIQFTNFFNFIFTLFFPFLGKKDYQTVPFSTIEMYNPEKLDSAWQKKVTDINGYYSLSSPLLNSIFVKITSTGRYWKNIIIKGSILPNSCLFPILEDSQITSDRLQILSMRFRSIPLFLACLTSSIGLVTQPNYFYLIYLYLSLHLVFSEYLYPKISK